MSVRDPLLPAIDDPEYATLAFNSAGFMQSRVQYWWQANNHTSKKGGIAPSPNSYHSSSNDGLVVVELMAKGLYCRDPYKKG
jgi:hypothetical protein